MPYIKEERRNALDAFGDPHKHGYQCAAVGELNFIFTCAALGYLERHGLSYQTINDIRGALSGAQAEFERRVAYPYEDAKKEINGDVYP